MGTERGPERTARVRPSQERLTLSDKWTEHEIQEIWEKWSRGGGRCPYCIDGMDEELVIFCDCWQAEREGLR